MNSTHWARALAAMAAFAAAAVFAQMAVAPSGAVTTTTGVSVTTSTPDMDTWVNDYSVRNNGRITRQAYLDEMGRRWDAMDANRQGLTPAQISRLTGKVDSNAPAPLTGTGVQPGNMGPGNAKGK
jgi:hypothetical protein